LQPLTTAEKNACGTAWLASTLRTCILGAEAVKIG
jgi:hypothetical protein